MPKKVREMIAEIEGDVLWAAHAYSIVVHRVGRNWATFVPDLPGCVTAADTRREAEQLMREAIAFHVEGGKLGKQ